MMLMMILTTTTMNPTLGVSGELEYAKDSENTQSDESTAQVLVVGDAETDVVGQDGHDVDDAHDAPHVATSFLQDQRAGWVKVVE